MSYDTEQVIFDIEALFKSKLNTEIGLVNTEKSDSIVLVTIPTNTYVFSNFPSEIVNYEVCVVWGIEPNDSVNEENEINYIESTNLTYEVCLSDAGELDRGEILRRLLRYTKALKNVVMKNTDVLQGYGKVKVRALEPSGFAINKQMFLSAGIGITATITAR